MNADEYSLVYDRGKLGGYKTQLETCRLGRMLAQCTKSTAEKENACISKKGERKDNCFFFLWLHGSDQEQLGTNKGDEVYLVQSRYKIMK